MERQSEFHFFASSILFIYEGAEVIPNPSVFVRLQVIGRKK